MLNKRGNWLGIVLVVIFLVIVIAGVFLPRKGADIKGTNIISRIKQNVKNIIGNNYKNVNESYKNETKIEEIKDIPNYRLMEFENSHARDVYVVDLDGNNEIVVANDGQNFVYFINSNFTKKDMFDSNRSFAVAYSDIDNDGLNDIIIGNYDDESYIYYNKGDLVFDRHNFCYGYVKSIAISDLNNDGLDDIVVGKYYQGIEVFYNLGNKRFRNISLNGFYANDIKVSDINNDGYNDIVVAGIEKNYIFYSNKGNFSYDNRQEIKGGNSYSVDVGDINGDGYNDIVIGNYDKENLILLNLGVKSNNVSFNITEFDKGYTKDVKIADMNNDGYNDVVSLDYDQGIVILLNNKNSFVERKIDKKIYSIKMDIKDINNDGYNDFIIATGKGLKVLVSQIWLNQ